MAQFSFQVSTNKDDSLIWLLKSFKNFFVYFFVNFDTSIVSEDIKQLDDNLFSANINTKHININILLKKIKQHNYFEVDVKRLLPLENFNYDWYSAPTVVDIPVRVADCEEDSETKLFYDCLYMWSEYVNDTFKSLTEQYETASNWKPVTNDNYESHYYDGYEFERCGFEY